MESDPISKDELNAQFLIAARTGHSDLMIEFLEKGADINTYDDDGTALACTAKSGHSECVKILLKAGAEDNDYFPAIIEASKRGHYDCVKVLLESGAAVDARCHGDSEETALIRAAANGRTEVVKLLLEAGAEVDARDEENSTALSWAVTWRHVDSVNLLLEAGADVNGCDEDRGRRPLSSAANGGSSDLVEILLKWGAEVNFQDALGWTALHEAAESGSRECVELLLKAGAHVTLVAENIRDNIRGVTALHEAANVGSSDCVKLLLDAGAQPDAQDSRGKTAFCLAVEHDTDECEHSTARHQATQQNVQINNGESTFCLAAQQCVELLTKYSYLRGALEQDVTESRKRIFNALLMFRALGSLYDGFKCPYLQSKILSCNRLLQDDLVFILLDELKKGREIKSPFLLNSKEAAVRFLLKKLQEDVAKINVAALEPAMRNLIEGEEFEEHFAALILEGLDERFEQVKRPHAENAYPDQRKKRKLEEE